MSITRVALEGKFINADGSPASGTICARLNTTLITTLINGPLVLSPSVICGLLDGAGRIIGQNQRALVLYATDDAGTTPVGATYTLTLSLDGEMPEEFDTLMPHEGSAWSGPYPNTAYDPHATVVEGSPVITLVDIIASPTMVGAAALTGSAFTGSQTVISVDVNANTVTVGSNASMTGVDSDLAVLIGIASFESLRLNARA